MMNNLYNNVVKKRKLLLEAASKDIVRYYAGRNSLNELSPVYQNFINSLGPSGNIETVLRSIFASIEEPYTIKKIIKEISKIKSSDLDRDIEIIYKDSILKKEFGKESIFYKSATLQNEETIFPYDFKDYMGLKSIEPQSFNKSNGSLSEYSANRFENPEIAILKIKDHNNSFKKSKEASYAPLLASMIPAVEMSKCVPHLSVSIVDDDQNTNNLMSLSKFLVGRTAFENDSFARGLTTVKTVEKQDSVFQISNKVFAARSKETRKPSISGMEMFQSPQSLVNADINRFQEGGRRVLNPFLPFMSIESFSISDQLKPLELISTTSGNLKLKLYDRSRMPEIVKLIGVEYFSSVFLVIEFGWSHPDGSIISGNPFGQFLDSMKRRELFVISNSNVTVNDDGTVGIDLSITSLGEDSWKSSDMSQKFITKEDLNEYILSLEKKLKKSKSSGNRITLKTKKEKRLDINSFESNDLIYLEALEEINFFKRYEEIMLTTSSFDEDIKEKIDNLLFNGDSKGASLISVINNTPVNDEKKSSSLDEDSPAEKTEAQKKKDTAEQKENIKSTTVETMRHLVEFLQYGDGFITLANSNYNQSKGIPRKLEENKNDMTTVLERLKRAGFDVDETFSKNLVYDLNIDIKEKNGKINKLPLGYNNDLAQSYVSLARLLGGKYSLPEMLATRSHDEYQLIFHPANNRAGAFFNISLGDVFISTKKYLDNIANLVYKRQSGKLTIEDHLRIIRDILMSSDYEFGYGIAKTATPFDNGISALKELVKDDLSEPVEVKADEEQEEASSVADSPQKEAKKTKEEEAEELMKSRNIRLATIYDESFSEEEKTLQFKPINLKVKYDTLSYSDGGIIKKIKRIHFFDDNAESYSDEKLLLTALNDTNIVSALNSTSIPSLIPKLDNTNIFKKFTSNFSKKNKLSDSIDSETYFENYIIEKTKSVQKINSKVANEIDSIIKANVPTIEMGSENGFVQNITLTNNNGGLANQINMIDFSTSLSNPQNSDRSKNRSIPYLNPGTLNLTMLGCPVVAIGQTFYVTANTGTTLDNIYVVKSISHSISEGNFSTTISLDATNDAQFDPENITKKLIDIKTFNGGKLKVIR